jgi:hypothetical protein
MLHVDRINQLLDSRTAGCVQDIGNTEFVLIPGAQYRLQVIIPTAAIPTATIPTAAIPTTTIPTAAIQTPG